MKIEPKEIDTKICYDNRELSWLKFNERVLEEAEDESIPFGERLLFQSIYQSNLDEFFMVRVGSIYDQMLMELAQLKHKEIKELSRENKTQMTCSEQIEKIVEKTRELGERRDKNFLSLMNEMKKYGVQLLRIEDLNDFELEKMREYFIKEIKPLISPQIIGKRQPFPFLKSKEIYAIFMLETKKDKSEKKDKIGIIPCSNELFKRLVPMPTNFNRFILSEDLILYFASEIFKYYNIESKALIRITRNADIDDEYSEYDEEEDYREAMEKLVKSRKKLAPIRIELSNKLPQNIMEKLCEYIGFETRGNKKIDTIFYNKAPLDVSFMFTFISRLKEKEELFFEKRIPQKSPNVDYTRNMISQLEEKDILLTYPYERMKPFLTLLSEAAEDEEVVSIKMTLYRLAKNSKVVEALVEAAENGKEVLVLVELRARFDEESNILYSKKLEDAGCRVIYGLEDYKVHSKLCLITKRKTSKIEYITQIGTGNYNESTAGLYTDYSLMTVDRRIGENAAEVFNALSFGTVLNKSESLLVAPNCLQNKVIEMIDEEIEHAKRGEEAYIGVKLNSLTDKKIIKKFIEASKAGVKIDMVIRGICCLISKVKGKTENIRVVSIVGRYLEHSRIYIFGKGERKKIYISSADFMTRNTVKRVEIAVPIYDEDIKNKIQRDFDILLSDNVKAREQYSDGKYRKVVAKENEPKINAQELFFEESYNRALINERMV